MFALLLAFGIGYTLHAKDVFQPPKPPAPERWNEKVPRRESLEFQTKEGTTLRGWLYRADKSDAPFVLFFYGSNEDLANEANRLAWLSETVHVNAICFDYPGYGFSSGSVDVAAIESAALQEFDYVKQRLTPSATTPIVSYGWSIGTSMAIHVAGERRVAGLILQAPPATAEEMLQWSSKHDVPWYGRGVVKMKADPDVEQVYENAAAIHTVSSPLLVIQGNWTMWFPSRKAERFLPLLRRTKNSLWKYPGPITTTCDLHSHPRQMLSSGLCFLCNDSIAR